MSGIEAIAGVSSAMQALSSLNINAVDVNAGSRVGLVNYEQGAAVGADFAKILDTYRAKADRLDASVAQARAGEGPGVQSNQAMLAQLADLYSYAVDTQLLVKTSGQLTTGFRQLVTGQ